MAGARTQRTVALVGSLVWMAVIFGFSSLPGSSVPSRFGTLAHFGEYLVLGGLYLAALPQRDRSWGAAAVAILLASLYGATDEFHQSFTPGRVPDVADWLIDTAGAASGVLLAALVGLRARRR